MKFGDKVFVATAHPRWTASRHNLASHLGNGAPATIESAVQIDAGYKDARFLGVGYHFEVSRNAC